eukprot:4804266-Pyramimonas_sp.AAC.1
MNCAIEKRRFQHSAERFLAMKQIIVALYWAYSFKRCSARCRVRFMVRNEVRQLLAHPSEETEDGAIASTNGRSARLRLFGGNLSTSRKA